MSHAELRRIIDSGLPFTVHVADGRSFHVRHRDYIFLAPHSSLVVIAETNPENENETVNNTIPLHMVSGVTQTSRVAEE